MTAMKTFAASLSEARAAAGLSLEQLAEASNLEVATLRALEAGEEQPNSEQLDRISLMFGVRPLDFVTGSAAKGPATLLLKSSANAGKASLERLLSLNWGQGIGEFFRVARDLRDLNETLGCPRKELPADLTAHLADKQQAENEGARLADAVRERLGLGDKKIDSMRDLLEGLGVAVVWTDPEEFAKAVDGSSTVDPMPTVLVNLVGGHDQFWRNRMTMAHELCHILFDLKQGGAEAMVSPDVGLNEQGRRGARWNLFEGFEDIESRADAFAACFLAPRRGVQRAVAGIPPASEQAIRRVGKKYGVGRTVAINRLCDVFRLGFAERSSLASRRPWWPAEGFERDCAEEDEIGLRRGTLRRKALQAYCEGAIDAVEVRELLRVALTEELDEPSVPKSRRAPVVSVEDSLRRHAQRFLAREGLRNYFPSKVVAVDEEWIIDVIRADEPSRVRLTLRMSPGGEVLDVSRRRD